MSDPLSLWTIETPTRAYNEMMRTKAVNEDVKKVLDVQLQKIVHERQGSREADIAMGKEMVEADLEKTTREAQISAYKRHEMSK